MFGSSDSDDNEQMHHLNRGQSWLGPLPWHSAPAKKKRQSPAGDGAGSTSAAPAKKKTAYTSPYHVFCQEQRPLITPGRMTNAEREKHLGMRWKALPKEEQDKYKTGLEALPMTGRGGKRAWVPTTTGGGSAPPLAAAAPTPARLPTTSRSSGSGVFSSAPPLPPAPYNTTARQATHLEVWAQPVQQAQPAQAVPAAPPLGPSGFMWSATLVDRVGRWKNKLTNGNNTDVVRVNSAGSASPRSAGSSSCSYHSASSSDESGPTPVIHVTATPVPPAASWKRPRRRTRC